MVGVRDTLFGLLLNHAHRARDTRWSATGNDGPCEMCDSGSILEPHIQFGGPYDRDPSQVVTTVEVNEEDEAIRARMEEIRQR